MQRTGNLPDQLSGNILGHLDGGRGRIERVLLVVGGNGIFLKRGLVAIFIDLCGRSLIPSLAP